ncbi:DEAD/DEAH box helicase [Nordella sp. HKS 07]|uniref:DEAD/DEAH box helicase n=1 Tax=Nordella sp. HKS 07 TaxID=2712222 RepID=UPI0013E1C1E7|nr:DEAD/DEAH box helicase [Nordella sp. HKS 07]QIG46782.1 DEAD/DEAH box helicase [Nordella sp. HKS 07]
MTINLRQYQIEVIDELRAAVANGSKRTLLVAPTGAGKTVIASAIIAGAVAKGKRVLMVAHRRELIDQACRKLDDAGIKSGTILAGDFRRDDDAPVQVGSIQTIHARAIRGERMILPRADLLIVDEAHRVRTSLYQQLLDAYPHAKVVGLTATPCRSDGRGLGNVFNEMVQCPSVQELIDLGHLVKTIVYAPETPDLKGVKIKRGDYAEDQLAERMDKPKLVGDIVSHWHRLAAGRKTVVFATSIAHSKHIADEFNRAGVAAAHIDGATPNAERSEILAQLSSGQLKVVSNCAVLIEGWDQPHVSCCVLARPTKHMGTYRQMVGRVLRPVPGKDHALVLDHAGNTFEHGRVEDRVEWTLDADQRAENSAHRSRRQEGSRSRLVSCQKCSAVRVAGEPCPQCGWLPKRRGEAVDVEDGELARVDKKGKVHPRDWSAFEKDRFLAELIWLANEHGYNPIWPRCQFKNRIGHWPNNNPMPVEPRAETRAWIRSRIIAWAKSKGRAA